MAKQNQTGRAFEYGVAVSFAKYLPAEIVTDKHFRNAEDCFSVCTEKEQIGIIQSASEAVAFLTAFDKRLAEADFDVRIQSDQQGQAGDVRDVIVTNNDIGEEIGVSAKNRHKAVKHSRLSEHIDFGSEWLGIECSDEYFHEITPIFRELRSRKRRNELWRLIEDKHARFYQPILQAFQKEMLRLFDKDAEKVARAVVQYLLGRFDYYKVVKENGTTFIQSFNVGGTLLWGNKIPLPTRIIDISPKPKSSTTIFIVFDYGWQLSFRIHNASSRVEPSLKFDINIEGMPQALATHTINHNG